jgi:hypothetical protein
MREGSGVAGWPAFRALSRRTWDKCTDMRRLLQPTFLQGNNCEVESLALELEDGACSAHKFPLPQYPRRRWRAILKAPGFLEHDISWRNCVIKLARLALASQWLTGTRNAMRGSRRATRR